jgi:hypothetical protein
MPNVEPKSRLDPEPEWISRAEAGRRWGVSAQMVGRYCAKGMPARETDKRVPWLQADEWRRMWVCPTRSGSWRYRMFHKAG